jgi:hypothetical protein
MMPTHETAALAHFLLPFVPVCIQLCPVALSSLRRLDLYNHVDKCQQVLDAPDLPLSMMIKASSWSTCLPSEHDCLHILPLRLPSADNQAMPTPHIKVTFTLERIAPRQTGCETDKTP